MTTNQMTSTAAMIAHGAIMSPSERAAGRFMRGPDDSGHETNNAGGDPTANTNNNSTDNNTGQAFDAAAFWEQPKETPDNNGNQPSNDQSNQSGNQDSSQQLGTQLLQRIQGFSAKEVFTDEVVEGINNGDFNKFDQNLSKVMQQSMQQNVEMTVQLMQVFGERMMSAVEERMNSSFTSRENYAELETQIPSAKNPGVAPIVKSIYDRALALTKGDRTKAITMTKNMINNMALATGSDTGLHVAPVGSESNFGNSGPKVNWLEELNKA